MNFYYPLTVQRFLKSSLSGYADSRLLPKGFHLKVLLVALLEGGYVAFMPHPPVLHP